MSFTSAMNLSVADNDPVSERRKAIREALSAPHAIPEPSRSPAAQLEDQDSYRSHIRRAENKAAQAPERRFERA